MTPAKFKATVVLEEPPFRFKEDITDTTRVYPRCLFANTCGTLPEFAKVRKSGYTTLMTSVSPNMRIYGNMDIRTLMCYNATYKHNRG